MSSEDKMLLTLILLSALKRFKDITPVKKKQGGRKILFIKFLFMHIASDL